MISTGGYILVYNTGEYEDRRQTFLVFSENRNELKEIENQKNAEIPGSMIPFRRDELLLSTDPHMNDLSLSKWDAQHNGISRIAYSKIRVWSLSETVCCLKAMAQHLINR